MAIQMPEKRFNSIRYISRIDSAIDKEASDREAYEKDPMGNADKLVLKDGQEPTIFVLNFELNSKAHELIKNSRSKRASSDGVELTMGSWSQNVCRVVLKDIINPPGVEGIKFKKDGRGYVADSTLDILERLNIVDEIWTLYLGMTNETQEEQEHAPN